MEESRCLTKEKMKELINDNDIEFVRVECEDTNGLSRGLTLDVDYFQNRLDKGVPFPIGIYAFGPSKVDMIEGTGVTYEEGFKDGGAMFPDISTFRVLPWEKNVASVLSYYRQGGVNHTKQQGGVNAEAPLCPLSPRNICKLQVDKLKSLGVQLYGSFEFEFTLLTELEKEKMTDDVSIFLTHSQTKFLSFVKDVLRGIKGMGIRPEKHHIEAGPQEITCSPEFGLECPDNAFRFKHIVKEIASKNGMISTFMTQPFSLDNTKCANAQMSLENVNGANTGHFNHSLWDESGECLMYDSTRKYGFTEIAESWLAGLLFHSKALMCLARPFSNCFEMADPMIPVNISWGYDNRTVAYRIKNEHSSELYIENRLAGGAVNPYLHVAGSIIAGMDGIKRKLTLDIEPFSGCMHEELKIELLPTTLQESLECLKNDELFVHELGPEFMKCYSATRRAEYEKVEKARNYGDEASLFTWYRDNYAKFI